MKNSKKINLTYIRNFNKVEAEKDRRYDEYNKRWAAHKKQKTDTHFSELKEQMLKEEVKKNRANYFARFVGPDVMKSNFLLIKTI